MNSRERVLLALNHKEPDRVPYDMGGTVVTGIQAKAYSRLRKYLGLPEKEIVITDILQQLAQVDDDVMERMGLDFRNISPRSTASFKIELKLTPDGRYSYFYDEYQVGWRMPVDGGMYYDMFAHPLIGNITEDDVDTYVLPDPLAPSRFESLREAARKVLDEEKRALVIGNISAGIFELYLWTRGFKDGYTEWAENPTMAKTILRKYADLQLAYWERMFEVMDGIPIDVVQMADDLAGQNGMLISPASYRRNLKPFHKEMFDYIHSKTDAKIFFHSCGSIRPLIPDLIEVGVDILNPVQVSAANMDSAELKRDFGKDICFWGGGVDTQNAFDDRYTPEQVRADVQKHLQDLMPGGGFVFNTVHNIQGNVPPENIMAMWKAVQDCGVYQR